MSGKIAWGVFGLVCWFASALVMGLPIYGLIGSLRWHRDPLVDMPGIAILPVLGLGTIGLAFVAWMVFAIINSGGEKKDKQ